MQASSCELDGAEPRYDYRSGQYGLFEMASVTCAWHQRQRRVWDETSYLYAVDYVARIVRSGDDENWHPQPMQLVPQRGLDAGSRESKTRRKPGRTVALSLLNARGTPVEASEHRHRNPSIDERGHVGAYFELTREHLVVGAPLLPSCHVVLSAARAQQHDASYAPWIAQRGLETVTSPHRVAEKIEQVWRPRRFAARSRVFNSRRHELLGTSFEVGDDTARSAVAREVDAQSHTILANELTERAPSSTSMRESMRHHEEGPLLDLGRVRAAKLTASTSVSARWSLAKLGVKCGHAK